MAQELTFAAAECNQNILAMSEAGKARSKCVGFQCGDGDAKQRLYAIEGMVPNLLRLPDGCSFAPRCYRRTVECTLAEIPLESCNADAPEVRKVRCIHA